MQEGPNNLIEKLSFEIQAENIASPTGFLANASEFIQENLAKAIEEALDSLPIDTKLIVVEKLELDLKEIDWNNRDLLIDRLKTELLRNLQFSVVSQSHIAYNTQLSKTQADTQKQLSKKEERAERWAHYLQYGSLPWWDQQGTSITFNFKSDLVTFLKENDSEFALLFRSLLKDKFVFNNVVRRLQELLKDQFIPLVFISLRLESKIVPFTELLRLVNLVNEIRPISKDEFTREVWFAYFSNLESKSLRSDVDLISHGINLNPEYLWRRLLPLLQSDTQEFPSIRNEIATQWQTESSKILLLKSLLPSWYANAVKTSEALEKISRINAANWIVYLFETPYKANAVHSWLLDLQFKLKNTQKDIRILQLEQIRSLLELFFEINQKDEFRIDKIHPSISAKLSEIDQDELVIEKGSADKDNYDWLLRYLKTGSLPWLQRQFTQEDIEALIKEMYEENEAYFIQYFQKVDLYRYPQVWERIEKQFSPSVVTLFSKALQVSAFQDKRKQKHHRESILNLLFTKGLIPWYDVLDGNEDQVLEILISFYNEDPVFFRRAIEESKILEKPEFKEKIIFLLGERVWQFLQDQSRGNVIQSPSNVRLKLEDLLNDYHELTFQLEYYFKHQKFTPQILPDFQSVVQAIIRINTRESRLLLTAFHQRFPNQIEAILEEPELKILKSWIGEPEESTEDLEDVLDTIPDFLKPKTSPREKTEADKLLPEGTVLYVRNAGLVLLHPFINRFFGMLKLTEKRKFISDEAKEKAVHILQYLIFEKSDMPEFELTLNKILCGIPPVLPIKSSVLVSAEEHELSLSLLKGVIENWSILKNTSVENFRASFLLRDGKLSKEPDGWRLRVEQKGFDVLLKQIPWAYSTVKLPWMTEVIHVDWN